MAPLLDHGKIPECRPSPQRSRSARRDRATGDRVRERDCYRPRPACHQHHQV